MMNAKYSHKFIVRGHFVHFRNERYKETTRSKVIWRKPYIKGEGILIQKVSIITDKKREQQ